MSILAFSTRPAGPLTGNVRAPGDKSISHRALMFGAVATGTTIIHGLLEGDDILATAGAMRAFGAKIEKADSGEWRVEGLGARGLQTPDSAVDFGNAGTGVRLCMGLSSGYDVDVTYTGDESLSGRPMGRILEPLKLMGAQFSSNDGKLPVVQKGGAALSAIEYTPAHASAQIKSAVLLAGLNAKGTTRLTEPRLTRDHTENMLRAFGAKIEQLPKNAGQTVVITGPQTLTGTKVTVPGDPSSAAFLIAAALVTPGSDIVIENVMMNKTRTGLFEVLTEMGAQILADNFRRSGGEIIADLRVKYARLRGISTRPEIAASMIDEYPILAVICATAQGESHLQGLAELKVKESDRLAATQALLVGNGVDAKIEGDSLRIKGGPVRGGGLVTTHHDHRIAMSALILGLIANLPVKIDDATMIKTSFPSFFEVMKTLGAPVETGPVGTKS